MNKNIIKLGGSIITDNSAKANFNKKNALRLAKDLYPFHKGCVLIHGTGQVGKPPAIEHGYVDSGLIGKNDRLTALTIKRLIRQLNQHFVQTLLSVSIPAIPIDILHFYNKPNNQFDHSEIETMLSQMINNGLVPVFYGDLIPMADGSFKVFSSDLITLILARILNPENVFFLTDVNGVYSENRNNEQGPNVIPVLNTNSIKHMQKNQKDNKDVSGGMQKKVIIALETAAYCKRCFIGNGLSENILSKLLTEKKVIGTIVTRK